MADRGPLEETVEGLLPTRQLREQLRLAPDRPLGLAADVRTYPLADLFEWIHGDGVSGLLLFRSQEHAKTVYLNRGEVIFATSNLRVDRLGESLVRAGVITFEQLREAERRFTPPERFGKVLVEREFLSPRELWNGVRYQVEEIVRSLFSYASGCTYLWDGDVQPNNVVRLSLPTRRLVSEGLQRRSELMRFLAQLEDARIRVEAVPGREASLAGAERRLFEALQAETSFSALCRRLDSDALSVARTIQLLRLVGAVRIRRTRDRDGYLSEGDLRAHEDEAVRECVEAHVKLMDALLEPLVAAEGPEPLRERLSHVIHELSDRHPELLRGIEPGPEAGLDPEELVGRASRLGGEPALQLEASLGELIAYLEFELKNHPGVDDADCLLQSLEPLRARLRS